MDEAKLTQLLGPDSARYAINTVQVWQTVDETHAVVGRDRLWELIKQYGNEKWEWGFLEGRDPFSNAAEQQQAAAQRITDELRTMLGLPIP